MTVSPAQHVVMVELLSRATRLNCHGEAQLIVETITALVEGGETGLAVVRWLSLLPRARGKQALRVGETQQQLSLINTEGLHPNVVNALRPPRGPQDRTRSADRLLNPDEAHMYTAKRERVDRHGGRPDTGTCRVCQAEFVMNRHGRPASTCDLHRRRRRTDDEAC